MRVCMVAYSFYEKDNRVRRYAETLAKRGDHVDVIALRQQGQTPEDMIEGVRVFRIQYRVVNEKSKSTYLARLLLFFLRSAFFLTREHMTQCYDIVHVHSVPDFEIFAAFYPKLRGSKLILDIHDIVPELYASKFKTSQDSLIFKMLLRVERMSAAFSDHVIVANHIWEKRLRERSVEDSKCTTILNFPDFSIFHPRGRNRTDTKFIIIYPGSLSYHQGVDLAIRALSLIKDQVPEAEFHIYGSGDQVDFLNSLVTSLGLQHQVFLKGDCSLSEIPLIMENADLGVVPKRKDSFGNEAFSTKIFEFMSLDVPVLVSDTMIDRYYFNESVVKFFRGGDENDLAHSMLRLIKDADMRHSLIKSAKEFIRQNNWEVKKAQYLNLVDGLVAPRKSQTTNS
jgi:glycosyltransferase involved in cell wall biosynthesis